MFCYSRSHFKKQWQMNKIVRCKIFTRFYSSLPRPCYNANTWPSFLIIVKNFLNTLPNYSNSCSSFRFSLKASKTKRTSVWTTWSRVLKQILSQPFLLNWIFENVINKKQHIFIEILWSTFYQYQLKLFLEPQDQFYLNWLH